MNRLKIKKQSLPETPNPTKEKKIEPETIYTHVKKQQQLLYMRFFFTFILSLVALVVYIFTVASLAPPVYQLILYSAGVAVAMFLIMRSVKRATDKSYQPLVDSVAYALHEADSDAMHVTDSKSLQTLYTLRDSLAEQNAQSSLSESLSGFLARSGTYVVVANSKGEILFTNHTLKHWQSGNSIFKLRLLYEIAEEDLVAWLRTVKKSAITAEKSWQRVKTDPTADQTPRVYDLNASYSRSSNAEVVLVFQDKTERYKADEKDLDFIAFAAHELRGPITVIRGYLEVMRDELDDSLNEMQKTVFGRLEVSANRLSGYINNILNVARYDRRHFRVELSEHNIADIYHSIQGDMESRAQIQKRSLVVNIPSDLPTIAADANSIGEVFTNLIDNAIKYTSEAGLIVITAEATPGEIVVHVRDNGIGMPESVVHNLFHKFYRSHRSRESVAGTGIGLYLCKAILESHGGTISVRSSPDKGSTFTFTIPLYEVVQKKLKTTADGTNNEHLINKKKTWISNHNMYRG